jgi:hypothetical protein
MGAQLPCVLQLDALHLSVVDDKINDKALP